MICNKKKQRTINNIFEIFTCSSCNKEFIYDYIYIGNNTINIYKSNNECINTIKKQKFTNLFLKEKIIKNNDLYLILDDLEYIKIFDFYPLLLDNLNCNIYILIL